MNPLYRKLNHVGVFVENREKAVSFYQEVLGGEHLFDYDCEADGERIAMIGMDGFHVELIEPPKGKEQVEASARNTFNHFAIETGDIGAAVANAQKFGCTLEEEGIYPVPAFGGGEDIMVAFIHGMNGERIEFFQIMEG